ncbi:MAG: dTDP-4-dehydrorhamnose 3,5-epimerase [Eubacterium sp.]|nr:dTDP-4-dehydrorhamnose 3,5-epimerase [Eubacterium sp.]
MPQINVEHSPGGIAGLAVIQPVIHGDERGYFTETYNKRDFEELGLNMNFVQDNQSKSTKGVLRGLHFQKKYPQGKLVRVIFGTVFDAAVDLRKNSPTYGKYFGIKLSGENMKQFYIPEGFAHGFIVLSDEAVFAYKCTDFYHPDDEGGLMWDDPDINIDWHTEKIGGTDFIVLSEKDKKNPTLKEIEASGFKFDIKGRI